MYFPSTRGGELPKTIKSYRSARKLRSNPINEKKEEKRAEKRDGELREARPGPAPHSPLGGGRVELRGRYGGGQRSKQLPPPRPRLYFRIFVAVSSSPRLQSGSPLPSRTSRPVRSRCQRQAPAPHVPRPARPYSLPGAGGGSPPGCNRPAAAAAASCPPSCRNDVRRGLGVERK